jgi:hypothetical protein
MKWQWRADSRRIDSPVGDQMPNKTLSFLPAPGDSLRSQTTLLQNTTANRREYDGRMKESD